MTNQPAVEAPVDAEALAGLRETVRGPVLTPDDPSYDEARSIWNGLIDRRPALIVQCSGAADVVDAVNFAREQGLALSIPAGGHNVAGNAVNDGGIVIDLSQMRGVHVDPARTADPVQGGATWGDLDRETQLFGLAVPGGVVSTTGVAGLTLHGGIGHLRRKHGLSIDNLISVDIVTADGQLRRASATENADLFWAMRGAGSNFGVVTSFEFPAHPVGPMVYVGAIFYPFEEARDDPRGVARLHGDGARRGPLARDLLERAADAPFPPEHPRQPGRDRRRRVQRLGRGGRAIVQPLRELAEPVVDRAAHGRGSACSAASTRSSRRASCATGSRGRTS